MSDRFTGEFHTQVFTQAALREREKLCVQQEPPACTTACPIHLDARALAAAVAAGDFRRARNLIEALTVFSGILGYTCDGPCKKSCRLSEVSEGIDMHLIERACIDAVAKSMPKRLPMKAKGQKAGIFGSDFFCLALAYELEKKAYDVTLFIEGGDLMEGLASHIEGVPESVASDDIKAFKSLNISIRYNVPITVQLIQDAHENFEIVAAMDKYLPQGRTANPKLCYDPASDIFCPSGSYSTVNGLMKARIAGASIDRKMQGVAMDRDRTKEEPYETKLFTDLKGVEVSTSIFSSNTHNGDSRQTAVEEAARCIQCECLECVKGCVYMQEYKRYPRTAVREVYNNLLIAMGNHMANGMINSCAVCGQCAAICPNGMDLGEACLMARQMMVAAGKMPPSTHEFALLDMEFSMGDDYFFASHQKGFQQSAYVFFPGCQLGALYPETLLKTYEDLQGRLSGGVGILTGCCSAIAYWSGREDRYQETLGKIKSVYESLGSPAIITACPSCYSMIKAAVTENVTGVWEILQNASAPLNSEKKKNVDLHDACGARNQPEMQTAVRKLAASLGYEINEAEFSGDKTPCCGFGGLQYFANRALSDKTASVIASGKEAILSYCPNCAERFSSTGSESIYLLEAVYGKEKQRQDQQPLMDFSTRRYNRRRVKQTLVRTIKGEQAAMPKKEYMIEYVPGLREKMEQRMILTEDVEMVIDAVRASASPVLYDEEANVNRACARSGNITFWIAFHQDGDEPVYAVESAYSHRMEVVSLL